MKNRPSVGECQKRIVCLLHVFSHSGTRTPRNEALLEAVPKQARPTRHPWLIACDANMCPEDCQMSF